MNFVTVPAYIFCIFGFESGLWDLGYILRKTSTANKLVLSGSVCVSKEMGTIE